MREALDKLHDSVQGLAETHERPERERQHLRRRRRGAGGGARSWVGAGSSAPRRRRCCCCSGCVRAVERRAKHSQRIAAQKPAHLGGLAEERDEERGEHPGPPAAEGGGLELGEAVPEETPRGGERPAGDGAQLGGLGGGDEALEEEERRAAAAELADAPDADLRARQGGWAVSWVPRGEMGAKGALARAALFKGPAPGGKRTSLARRMRPMSRREPTLRSWSGTSVLARICAQPGRRGVRSRAGACAASEVRWAGFFLAGTCPLPRLCPGGGPDSEAVRGPGPEPLSDSLGDGPGREGEGVVADAAGVLEDAAGAEGGALPVADAGEVDVRLWVGRRRNKVRELGTQRAHRGERGCGAEGGAARETSKARFQPQQHHVAGRRVGRQRFGSRVDSSDTGLLSRSRWLGSGPRGLRT